MSAAFTMSQRDAIVAGLAPLYVPALLIQPGVNLSDGRGGFAATTNSAAISVQREALSSELTRRNIDPDKALIFVLNDGSATPVEGNSIQLDGVTYMITAAALDPVGAVWECICAVG
jgi:hypothetical protein